MTRLTSCRSILSLGFGFKFFGYLNSDTLEAYPTMRRLLLTFLSVSALFLVAEVHSAEGPSVELLQNSKRLVFLGDSITAAGKYVANFEAWMVARGISPRPHVIDMGLPSETVSGLSEDGHAGGKFPRPVLSERLDRVLKLSKPDLVIACYGINCGIYQPFDESRFVKYQQGIASLKESVEKTGAKFIIVTPPFYDDQTSPRSFSYNKVLDRYSDWLLSKRSEGWMVVDLHGPMTKEIERRRKTDPKYTFQPDGVHPNDDGYWFIASEVIRAFGDEKSAQAADPQTMIKNLGKNTELLTLVQSRVTLIRDSYVATAGHKRPGMPTGLPIDEAETKSGEISRKIETLLKP